MNEYTVTVTETRRPQEATVITVDADSVGEALESAWQVQRGILTTGDPEETAEGYEHYTAADFEADHFRTGDR